MFTGNWVANACFCKMVFSFHISLPLTLRRNRVEHIIVITSVCSCFKNKRYESCKCSLVDEK